MGGGRVEGVGEGEEGRLCRWKGGWVESEEMGGGGGLKEEERW